MARLVPYRQLADDAATIIGSTVYATMTTVDKLGRPRSRVLIAVWEFDRENPVGWLATHKTPVKTAHLAPNPHVSTSYWTPRQNVVTIDSVAAWVDDAETADYVWNLYRSGSPRGNGYDPGQYWTGPSDPKFHVLRLDPWRIQVLTARELADGLPYRQARLEVLLTAKT
jgi:general stress protein 26